MLDLVSLRKSGNGWEFSSEAALEDFVWTNLTQLFGLTPLKRQYSVDGQYCDILALGESQQLVVLELKNVEDRYVVQQLTRYCHALSEEKAFSEQIDYEKPVRLIAVTPSFHRDNLIDRKYHHLSIEFCKFAVLADSEKFYLQLKEAESEKVTKLEIPFQEKETKDDIPNPPRAFLKLLLNCNELEKQEILRIRSKILSFDPRMEETPSTGIIKYGKGENLCAELRFDSKTNQPVLFLWVPLISRKPSCSRARIWTDWTTVSHICCVKEGLGKVKTLEEWKIALNVDRDSDVYRKYGRGRIKNSLVAVEIEQYKIDLRNYRNDLVTIDKYENLEVLIHSCLEHWQKKL
jgi:RecB family endonuclease NucS